MARVSVIVPAFDAASTLGEALASVQAQTYRDWEVVVGDDCSTDETAQIAGSHRGVTVTRTAGRAGPAGARNAALTAASGEILALLDADDAWEPQFLERMVAAYDAAGPEIGIVCCDALVVDEDGTVIERHSDRVEPVFDIDVDVLLRTNPILVCTLTPLALVRELGGFAEETWGSEDHDLWLRIAERGRRIVRLRDVLVRYRETHGSVSSSLAGMAATNAATYRRALARGHLDRRQRRLAARELQLHETVGRLAEVGTRPPRAAILGLIRLLPALARTAVANPGRWPTWLSRPRRLS